MHSFPREAVNAVYYRTKHVGDAKPAAFNEDISASDGPSSSGDVRSVESIIIVERGTQLMERKGVKCVFLVQ